MKKQFLYLTVCLFFTFCTACTEDEADLTGRIYGLVTDYESGEPVRNATISLSPGGLSATTGSDGIYEFGDLEPRQYAVQITASNYQTNTKRVDVVAGQIASGDMALRRGSSKISLGTNSLNFGTDKSSLSFTIHNVSTSGSVSWNISQDLSWLTVSPTSGTIDQEKSVEVIVTLLRDNITESVEGILLVNGEGESYSISVNADYGTGGGNEGGGNEGGGSGNITSGLVAYYTFDNENGRDATDSEMHGSLINSPDFVEHGSGKGLFLNGAKNQYMNIPYNPFRGTSNYTVSLWVKDLNPGVVFSALTNSSASNDFPRFIADQNSMFYLGIDYNTRPSTFSYNYKEIQDGQWHMLTIVVYMVENSYTVRKELYVDGMLVDSGSESSVYQPSTPENSKIQIGGNGEGKYTVYQSMKVDNIRFYSRPLEAKEVSSIYQYEK